MGGTTAAEPPPPRGEEQPPVPAWSIPPEGGFTAADLDRMPGLPPHTELLDGSLVLAAPRSSFHTLAVFLLERSLHALVPAGLRVRREMSVILGKRDRPEPDVVLLRASAVTPEADETGYRAEDVVLAVEVVSPDSVGRDRELKPRTYAQAGVPHFWRVEKGEGRRPVVHVYELDPATRRYALTGIHHDRLTVPVPVPLDIDLTEIDTL